MLSWKESGPTIPSKFPVSATLNATPPPAVKPKVVQIEKLESVREYTPDGQPFNEIPVQTNVSKVTVLFASPVLFESIIFK
jgi:hypothetical protein